LTDCTTAWYGNRTALDRMALQRVVRTAQYITGAELLAIQDLLYQAVLTEGLENSSQLSHRLFSLLPVSLVIYGLWTNL
jgi:hypothetical protein